MGGSSPLARGKCETTHVEDCPQRFIPTRAGKIRAKCTGASTSPVHPHSRGENGARRVGEPAEYGSSPLARGKYLRAAQDGQDHRFIPTRAGKIFTGSPRRARPQVHPHSRGENHFAVQCGVNMNGSSPLARGKYPGLETRNQASRFIPTRAGKICTTLAIDDCDGVHPHSRGENLPDRRYCESRLGSSPLARGKLGSNSVAVLPLRFIPTRAGKIRTWPGRSGQPWVHPHSRGENPHGQGG